jgi:hypothetical protein
MSFCATSANPASLMYLHVKWQDLQQSIQVHFRLVQCVVADTDQWRLQEHQEVSWLTM